MLSFKLSTDELSCETVKATTFYNLKIRDNLMSLHDHGVEIHGNTIMVEV